MKVKLVRVVRPEDAPPAELAVAEVLWLAEFVADDFDPVGVLLVQRFASDFRDVDIGVESHVYLSLVTIGLKTTVFGQRRSGVAPQEAKQSMPPGLRPN